VYNISGIVSFELLVHNCLCRIIFSFCVSVGLLNIFVIILRDFGLFFFQY